MEKERKEAERNSATQQDGMGKGKELKRGDPGKGRERL
jgi:hypothetical protein